MISYVLALWLSPLRVTVREKAENRAEKGGWSVVLSLHALAVPPCLS